MAQPIISRKGRILFSVANSYAGAAALAPAGADALEVMGIGFGETTPPTAFAPNRTYPGRVTMPPATDLAELSFSCRMASCGAANIPNADQDALPTPSWMIPLQACMMGIVASGDGVTRKLDAILSGEAENWAAIDLAHPLPGGGYKRRRLRGALGNFNCRVAQGDAPIIDFSFSGFVDDAAPDDAGVIGVLPATTPKNPPAFNGPNSKFEIDGISDFQVYSSTFGVGNVVTPRDVAGGRDTFFSDRAPTCSITLAQRSAATKNWIEKAKDGDGVDLKFFHGRGTAHRDSGETSGEALEVVMHGQLEGIRDVSAGDGALAHELTFALRTKTAAGNDELSFIVR